MNPCIKSYARWDFGPRLRIITAVRCRKDTLMSRSPAEIPRTAIEHIRKVTDELIPGYPADIHFFDTALEELYSKSGRQER